MDTFKSKNRGYEAKRTVVTYCQNRKEIDDRSKFRILLMTACIPEFWTAREGELITSELALRILSSLSEEQFLPKMDRTSLNNTLEKLVIKILLKNKDFDGALNILDQAFSKGIQLDVLLFNTILQAACDKGRLDVVELLVERMHEEKIHPDPSTCGYVFSAYVNNGFFSTAVEALQVLSMRMILADDHSPEEKRDIFEEDLIFADDLEAESNN